MCHHVSDDTTHDLCRAHSYCSKNGQYHGATCAIYEDLWEQARDTDAPEEAMTAFQNLSTWIKGFRKNSRNRPRGQDHFVDPQERASFQELHAIHANFRWIAASDASQLFQHPPLVSTAFLYCLEMTDIMF